MNRVRALFLPGDGVGPEVAAVARSALERALGSGLEVEEAPIGGVAIDATGAPVSEETLARAGEADFVFLGAVGGPRWSGVPFAVRPEAGLLRLRQAMGVYANVRPAVTPPSLAAASPLRLELARAMDFVIVRELTGGIYFGEPRGIETGLDGVRRGVNTHVYTAPEVHRVARAAFELARGRKGEVVSVDKANVMEAGAFWREEVERVHAESFSDVALEHMLADACAMRIALEPGRFDVILTDNLFGDMLSDEAAALTGSLGLAPSASLGDRAADGRRRGLYEPVHGSAPDIAGQNRANPLAALGSVAMALRWSCGRGELADALDAACASALADGARTADIARPGEPVLACDAMGDAVLERFMPV